MDMHSHEWNENTMENPNATVQGATYLRQIGLVLHVQYPLIASA